MAQTGTRPLALVTPLVLAALLATFLLGASDADRRWVLVSYAAGAVVNFVVMFSYGIHNGGSGATLAVASGFVVTGVLLLLRYARVVRQVALASRTGRDG